MRVNEIMTRDVVTVQPNTPFKAMVETLVRSGVSCVPVLDDEHHLLGIVTEADLISKEAFGGHRRRALAVLADLVSAREHHWVTKAAGNVATDVMTHDVVVCTPRDDVRAAARRMLEHRVKRLPVVDEHSLVGIVSRQDILRMFDRPDDAISEDLEKALVSIRAPDDHHVRFAVDAGVVTLAGDVRYAWDIPVVVQLARDVEGVIDVVNHVHHREPTPHPATPRPWVVYRSGQ